jgi:lipoate-protein ligase A
MAIDDAILETVIRKKSPPTLRFYSWKPACLSLGYAQPIADVDRDALFSSGWDLVRRPTGGRAILHIDELTYSVVGTEKDPRLVGGVLASYQNLSAALLQGLHLLGIPAVAVEDTSGFESEDESPHVTRIQNPVCFEVPSSYEITFSGKKLIGSAQARRKGGVLQHGSLPLFGDLTRIIRVLAFQNKFDRNNAAIRLSERAITAEQASGRRYSWDEAAQAFCRAFEETLNLELVPEDLTQDELELARGMEREKYANLDWTTKN